MNLQLDKVCSTIHRVNGGVRMTNLCQTLSTCQQFNDEVCYGSGLEYNTDECGPAVKQQVEDFLLDNALPSYFLGVCQDFKHFAFCVSVIILNTSGGRREVARSAPLQFLQRHPAVQAAQLRANSPGKNLLHFLCQ